MMIIGGMVGGAILIEGARLLFAPSASPPPEAPVSLGGLSEEAVSRVVAHNEAELRDRCFVPHAELDKATVTIDLQIASNGEVQSTRYEGSDGRVTACVDREVRTWRFPSHGLATASTRIPFVFERIGGR